MKTNEITSELTFKEKAFISGGHSHVMLPEPGTCSCNPGGDRRPWEVLIDILLPIHVH